MCKKTTREVKTEVKELDIKKAYALVLPAFSKEEKGLIYTPEYNDQSLSIFETKKKARDHAIKKKWIMWAIVPIKLTIIKKKK